MTEPSQSKLRQVRRLLDVAEHPNTDSIERENAMAKAMELMQLYSIDRAMLAMSNPDSDPIDMTVIDIPAAYFRAKVSLLNSIADNFRCKLVFNRYAKNAKIVGADSDREQVIMLYTSLMIQLTRELLSVSGYSAGNTKSLRNTFMHGYRASDSQRLAALHQRVEQQAETGQPGTALVLADRKSLVDRRVAELCGKVTNAPRARIASNYAYRAGRDAADRADIGITRLDQQHRELAR